MYQRVDWLREVDGFVRTTMDFSPQDLLTTVLTELTNERSRLTSRILELETGTTYICTVTCTYKKYVPICLVRYIQDVCSNVSCAI